MSRIDIIGSNGNDGLHYPDPIVEAVRQKLLDRSQAGILKYGTRLDRDDLTRADWLKHAQEEALDLANYLQVLLQTAEQDQADAARYRWLLAQLQATYDERQQAGEIVTECFMAWGHKSDRSMTATLTWQDQRDEPLDLSAAIDRAMS